MTRYAALLRAVNVGGRMLPMAELKAVAAALGYREGRTLLASGNIIFDASDDARTVERALEAALADRFGFKSEVFALDAADLARIVAANPFGDAARERPSKLQVHVLAAPLPPGVLDAVRAANPGSERMEAHGRALYVDYIDGVGLSKVPAAMKKAKMPVNTARNWNTIVKLDALLDG